MTTTAAIGDHLGLLDKERIIAPADYNRWLVPPAALAIHLCIGMAYGFSVFWKPLQGALLGADGKAVPECSAAATTFGQKTAGTLQALFTTSCNWSQFDLGWMYTLFFVLLGTSAAIWGGWLERVGPRRAGVVAAFCWSGGFLISALGVYIHQLWLMWLGSGIIGGCGLGLGYISPVSTLIKWFPDRRGMATGMAIMGFGGGAMIGSPLATMLMNHYATPTSPGVQETFGGRLFGDPSVGFGQFSDAQKAQAALVGASFVGLFSLFNIAGRFFWASLSDKIGRKPTYFTFFTLGFLCYA